MLTTRVGGSGASIHCLDFWPNASELLIENPPPRTPNLPATDGSARIAAAALPPFRFRSSPHPQRTSAGDALTYRAASRRSAAGSMPASAAALSIVHPDAAAR